MPYNSEVKNVSIVVWQAVCVIICQ